MSKNRRIFIIACIIFFIILAVIAYDIATRTTFPGGSPADTTIEDEAEK